MFIYNLTSAQRATVITDQAANQTIGRYVNMYPAFFPNCPTNLGYDSLRDGTGLLHDKVAHESVQPD